MATILSGLRVVDFTAGMAGSLATMLLADNGADVVKVEPPGGDPYRSEPAWRMWNRGKRSVVLELETATGRENAQKLAQQADVVLENFRPGLADRLGIGYEELARGIPRLIYCSISAFGSKGPYAHLKPYNAIAEAKAGGYVQMQNSMQRDVPTYRVRPNGSYGAANLAVQGIAAALRVREKTGLGQRLETTLFHGLACYDSSSALSRQAQLGLVDVDPDILGRRFVRFQGVFLPYLVVRCKDGQWIQMTNNASRIFPNWMKAIGLGHIYQDPRFKGAPSQFPSPEDILALRDMIQEKMQEKTFEEWIEIFIREDVAGDRFVTTQQAMDHPQIRHIGGVVEIDDPGVGKTLQIGPLAQFTETPSEIHRPAPLLGQHTEEVLTFLSAGSAAMAAPVSTNGSRDLPKHPFEGLLLLDFSTWLASPFGASLVADLGARVIKIEPLTGDEFRGASLGRGRTFQGKESMVIDLKTNEGRQIIHQLITKADALLHNMRGEAPQRLGIDYETVRKINPRLVYLYAGSYGSTGPGAGRAAFHPIGGALSGGVLWQMGRSNELPANDVSLDQEELFRWSRALSRANEGSPDVTSAIGVGTALSLGLYAREHTGQGQYIETRMLMSNSYMCSDDFIRYEGKPPRLEPDRDLRGLHALHRLYQAAEGWVFLTCPLEEEWQALCRAIQREDLITDPRFVSRETRLRHDDQLIAILWLSFRQRTAEEWEAYLAEYDVPCVRADKAAYEDFFLADPGAKEHGLAAQVSHPTTGRMFRPSPAVQFSLTPSRAGAPHLFGEDTPAILAELGLSAEEIQNLKSKGIIAWEELTKEAAAAPVR